jgi:Archaeal flagella assembly protein J
LAGLFTGLLSILIGAYLFTRPSENIAYPFDFIVLGIFLLLAPAGIKDTIEMRKMKGIENRLPDFLRDVSEASRFGSNLANSIITASEGQYGILTPEIKKIAAQIKWGVSVDEALREFVARNRSPFTEKLIATVIESNRSGGNVSDVLNLIAMNSKEAQILANDKYSQMRSYIIILLMAYGVFLLTVLILDVQFFPQMSSQLVSGTSSTTLSYLNVSSIPLIKEIFTGVVIIQGVGSGLMSGVLGEGRYQSGFLYSAVLSVLGYIIILLLGGV